MWAFAWYWIDPLASLLIGLLVIYSSWSLIRQSVAVLMEGAPGHVNVLAVRRESRCRPRCRGLRRPRRDL